MAHDQRIVLGVSFGDVVEIFAYRAPISDVAPAP